MRLKQEDYEFEVSLDKIGVSGLNNRLKINRNVDVQLTNGFLMCVCVYVYIYVCVCEYVHVCAHVCCGQRLTLHLLLNHFPCYSLRQGLSWNPEIMDLARRSGPGIPLPLPSATR